MLQDAFSDLNLHLVPEYVVARDIVHADDIALAAQRHRNLHHLLDAIVLEGQNYGFKLRLTMLRESQMGVQSKL